jgi:hypothetical protein
MLNCSLCLNPVEYICMCSSLLLCKSHQLQHAHQPYCTTLPLSSCSSKNTKVRKHLNLTDPAFGSLVLKHTGLSIFNPEDILGLFESSDGLYLTISSTGTINSWNMENDSIEFVMRYEKPLTNPLCCLCLNRYNSLILTNAENGIECINLENKKVDFVFTGHTEKITILKPTPNEDVFFSASWDFSLRFWSYRNRSQIRKIDFHYTKALSLAISHDSKYIAFCSNRPNIDIYGIDSGRIIFYFRPIFSANDIEFLQSSNYLVCPSYECIQIYRFKFISAEFCYIIPLRSNKVQSLGSFIVSFIEGCIQVWNCSSNQEIVSIFEEASHFILSHNNSKVIVYNNSTKVSEYDLVSGINLRTLERHQDKEQTCIISSGDLKFLVTVDKRK